MCQMGLPTKWPHKIKSGNASISIYQIENKGYQEFKVVYYDAERKRRFKTCAEFADAKKFAENVTATIGNGEISALTLTNTDRLLYLRAVDSLRGTGFPLDSALGPGPIPEGRKAKSHRDRRKRRQVRRRSTKDRIRKSPGQLQRR